jgi:hypothetical protein
MQATHVAHVSRLHSGLRCMMQLHWNDLQGHSRPWQQVYVQPRVCSWERTTPYPLQQ